MPYKNEERVNARAKEIQNLRPEIFKLYLEGLDEQAIMTYEDAKSQIGYSSREDRIFRHNSIHNKLSINQNNFDTFTLKLIELANLFPSDKQWERFAVGDASRGEEPLSDEKLAFAYNTTVNNVVMKKMLDEAIRSYKIEKGITYSKKMDN